MRFRTFVISFACPIQVAHIIYLKTYHLLNSLCRCIYSCSMSSCVFSSYLIFKMV